MDDVTIREFMELKALAERADGKGDLAIAALEKLTSTVERIANEQEARHRENEKTLASETHERGESIRRVHRRIDDEKEKATTTQAAKDAQIAKDIRELQDAKLMSKAWIGGMICAGTAIGSALGFVLHWAWTINEAKNTGLHP